ncbi:MAG: ArsR/SmtB family transcription factor [Pyrinomonadaceae bacterium]
MQESTLVKLEQLFLALADKTRLRLLTLMANGEVSVGFLADTLGESQPKISRHLAYLRGAGLVSTRRDGKWVYYGLEDQSDSDVKRILDATLRPSIDGRMEQPSLLNDGENSWSNSYQTDVSAESYIENWEPAEIEIFLL